MVKLSKNQINSVLENIKAVVFDMDGTLLDSLKLWETIDKRFFAERNIEINYDKYFGVTMGMTHPERAVYTKELFNMKESAEEILNLWMNEYYNNFEENVELFSGVLSFMQQLKHRGIKMGIATANRKEVYEQLTRKYPQLHQYIDVIVTCEEVGKSKPNPLVFNVCMQKLNASPSECLVFEDSVNGLTGAAASGAKVVCVLSDQDHKEIKLNLSQFWFEEWDRLT
ncbi:Beta-phosphoglucomutase [Hexamita inflata]|uniref:Beta-phosphoglucomutase n=1 Tax=Hexamita inflata TaxID=28002 RepID=A0AA86U8T8_9EUKA|nr:Beta-phosphoglucomutase [Hexamita inflata]